jgi:hypothetical protein
MYSVKYRVLDSVEKRVLDSEEESELTVQRREC